MSIGVYLNFGGNCREALDFYTDVFRTEAPRIMRYGDAPADAGYHMEDAVKDLVMHAEIQIKGSTIMFSDVPPGMPFTRGNNVSLILRSKDTEELKVFFNGLREGGTVRMELQETFWSKCYGFVEDKFGIGWQLSADEQ